LLALALDHVRERDEASPEVYALIAALGRRLAGLQDQALLVGWQAIAAHCQKQPRTLRRYVAREGFPAHRWGRFTVAAPTTSRIGCLFLSGGANRASRSPPKTPPRLDREPGAGRAGG